MNFHEIGHPQIPSYTDLDTLETNNTVLISLCLLSLVVFIIVPILNSKRNEKKQL